MKVLVFGRDGQVAQALLKQGPAHKTEVDALHRGAADLSDPVSCVRQIMATDAQAVINAAAWTAVDAAEDAEDQAYIVNAKAPGAMALAAASRALPFIHISTDYVFSGQVGPAWKPTDPAHPLSAYGRTKRAGEEAVMAAGGAAVILRTAWVFSETGNNFVKTMLRLAKDRDEMSVVADQFGGPTPADAIADACLTIAQTLAKGKGRAGIYHLSGTPDVNWATFARAVFERSGDKTVVNDITTADYPTPAMRPLNSRLDCSTLEHAFGINRPDWGLALDEIVKELNR